MSTSNPTVLSVWRHSYWHLWQLQYNFPDMCIQVTITNKPYELQLNMLSSSHLECFRYFPQNTYHPFSFCLVMFRKLCPASHRAGYWLRWTKGAFVTTKVRFRNSCTQRCCLLHAHIIAWNSVYRISCRCPRQQLNTVQITSLEAEAQHIFRGKPSANTR